MKPSWWTSTVAAIAEGIVADGAYHLSPVLADALEDAGCVERGRPFELVPLLRSGFPGDEAARDDHVRVLVMNAADGWPGPAAAVYRLIRPWGRSIAYHVAAPHAPHRTLCGWLHLGEFGPPFDDDPNPLLALCMRCRLTWMNNLLIPSARGRHLQSVYD